jgi:hypothetical protein
LDPGVTDSADPYDDRLPPIDDEEANRLLSTARPYTAVLLRAGPNRQTQEGAALLRPHGIRNMRLRAGGMLRVVVRVADDSDAAGIGIFALDLAETRRVVESDPAVAAGVFVAEYHPVLGFPDDGLAGPA